MVGRSPGSVENTLQPFVELAIREYRPIWLDTMAVIDYLQNNQPYAAVIAPLIQQPTIPVGISSITVAEVLAGPAIGGDDLMFARLSRALARIPALTIKELDSATAVVTARVRGRTGLRLPDSAIIASALESNAVVIIGNDRRWIPKTLGIPFLYLSDLVSALEIDSSSTSSN